MNNFMTHDFIITNLVTANFVPAGYGGFFQKHRPNHGLAIHAYGHKIYTFSTGEVFDIYPNDIIYMPINSRYEVVTTEPGDCYAINFELDDNITFPPFKWSTKNARPFIKSFVTAHQSWKQKYNGYVMSSKSELYNIIFNMQKEYSMEYTSPQKTKIIQPALDYIHNNYTSGQINVIHLAKLCSISETYLRRIFIQATGTSPIKYINNLKFTHARDLILSGMYSISEAAELSGFCDASHFSREFKKTTGVSPSELLDG